MNLQVGNKRIMKTDWSDYPPLPEPPDLPRWRDTPEREAYWNELMTETCRTSRSGCLFLLLSYVIAAAFFLTCSGEWKFSTVTGILLGAALFCAMVCCYLFSAVRTFIWKCRLARKYGFYMHRLKRTDLSAEIKKILTDRPDFSREDFRKYWTSDELADIAEAILKLASRHWYLSGRMLYPNDPVLFLFFGRKFRWGKQHMLTGYEGLGEFIEDIEDHFQFREENWENLEFDEFSFADLAEACLESAKGKNQTADQLRT